MTSKILVTGANGFIGRHLISLDRTGYIVETFKGDIQSFQEVYNQISSNKYDIIYHLAGLSKVTDCEKKPDLAYSINSLGTFNLLESLKRANYRTKLIFPSTAHVYASSVNGGSIIDEAFPTNPANVYAYTKLTAENNIRDYFSSKNLGNAIILRLFNHSHISQVGPFFFPQIIEQIKKSTSKTIKVGNLDLYRDFSLISDLMKLFQQIESIELTQDVEIFNVCSGQTRNLKHLAEEISRALGKEVNFEIDPSKIRKGESSYIKGSNLKCKEKLNWEAPIRSDSEFVKELLKN